MPKTIQIPADPRRQELDAIKARQRARKAAGTPGNVTNKEIWQMLYDILENQKRIESKMDKLLK